MFTHYSLFKSNGLVLQDFAPLPPGGISSVLSGVYDLIGHGSRYHIVANNVYMNPGGSQISLEFDAADGTVYTLVFMTLQAVCDHASELAGDGNPHNARLAYEAAAKHSCTFSRLDKLESLCVMLIQENEIDDVGYSNVAGYIDDIRKELVTHGVQIGSAYD